MTSVEAASISGFAHAGEESAAQKLQQHHATVEDVPDENFSPSLDAAPASTKPAAKKKSATIDTGSHELFPELGAPKGKVMTSPPIWQAKNITNGKTNGASRPSPPVASANATPTRAAAPVMSIPGQSVETITLEPQFIMRREELKKPIPDIIKDINRKSRATLSMSTSSNGHLKFSATGPQEEAQQALKLLVHQIGNKVCIAVPVPQSIRAHIIGKAGSTIKSLQEKTGAKITLPKVDENLVIDEDDETTVDVQVEGNALAVASARNAILKIAREKGANVQTKVRGIPTALYPFIAGPQNSSAQALEDAHGIRVRVPAHQTYSSVPAPVAPGPGQRLVFTAAGPEDEHIVLAGDRAVVQRVKEEIERQVAQLRQQLEAEQLSIPTGRHQFIIGNRGVTAEDFFAETGCIVLLDQDDDMITIVGPSAKLSAAQEKAMDLAMGMQMSNVDISKSHRLAPGGAAAHAANITRYLRSRREIERLENLYNTHINTPMSQDGAFFWELYARDGKDLIRAQSEITSILNGHPPSRMQTCPVDIFFHQHLRNDVAPRVKKDYGVHLVVPESSAVETPILLVYEGPETQETYQTPRVKPTAAEITAFKQNLEDAQKFILDLINQQEALDQEILDVPAKFHEKLRRFIKKEQENRQSGQIPVRVTKVGTIVTLKGPRSAVKALASKSKAFVGQEKLDEKERDHTISFDFDKKFANHLIGKGGSNIKELRDRFDVEIQVQDGKVELKGPPAKAEKARSHILSFARTLADETTHTLRIDPKYHRELIGSQGSQINRLQTRYKVLIFFPRSAKNAADDDGADAASDAGKNRRQQGPDEVIIRGPKKGADEARDEIFSLFQYLEEHSATATVSVQQKQVASLIGSSGTALDEVRQMTGARIDVPADRDTEIVEIQIKGTAAQVSKARQILEEKRATFEDTILQTIEVEKKHHRTLIGPNGSTLREIVVGAGGSDDRRILARTIQFPKQETDGNTIKVEGRSEVVQKIIKRIQEIVAERESQVTEVLDVPIDQHRLLIGRGGEAKRQLETKFDVSISVPRQGDGKTGVKLTGLPENVSKVKEHIAGLLKQQQGETIQIPMNVHHIIANNGQLFRQLRINHQVTVDHAGQAIPARPQQPGRSHQGALPLITDDADAVVDTHSWIVAETGAGEEGEIPWVLRGSAENVTKAKDIIQKALEQAKKNDTTGYLILPDPKTYRHVIGPNGSKVNVIRNQCGCKIWVPQIQGGEEAIEIVGTREGVEKAKELILAAVRDGLAK